MTDKYYTLDIFQIFVHYFCILKFSTSAQNLQSNVNLFFSHSKVKIILCLSIKITRIQKGLILRR